MNDNFILTHKNGLKIYQIPSFAATDQVSHGFTTRSGGSSVPPYDSLNMALHVDDNVEKVLRNRTLACCALGMNPGDLVAGEQVHGDSVSVVTVLDKGRGAKMYAESLPAVDALITNEPNVPLSSYYADCVPVFLFDPVRRVIALVHAGWKGTAAKISLKTVEKMRRIYGTIPADCLAGIGPSIGPCCYTVGEQVAGFFQNSSSRKAVLTKTALWGQWRLDLWQANLITLLEAGLHAGRITLAGICTACRKDLFFSYRAARGTTGRMASLIMLK